MYSSNPLENGLVCLLRTHVHDTLHSTLHHLGDEGSVSMYCSPCLHKGLLWQGLDPLRTTKIGHA